MKNYLNILGLSAIVAVFCVTSAFASVDAVSTGTAGPGVRVSWKAPKDVPASDVTGYNVYRSENMLGHYERVNADPIDGLSYDDRGEGLAHGAGLELGRTYYYRLTTMFTDGTESAPSKPVGMEAGGKPGTQASRLPEIEFFTTDALGRVSYTGEELVFILKGSPGLAASFEITGVAGSIPMQEVQPGSYKGVYTVPAGVKVRAVNAVAGLSDASGGKAYANTPATICMLGWNKPTLTGLYAGILEADRVCINWPKLNDAAGSYSVFRDTSRIVGTEDKTPVASGISPGVTAYIDTDVSPDATYFYVLALVGPDGLVEAYSENLEVVVPGAGKVSGMEQLVEDSEGRALVPGDKLTVTMTTSPGGEASFTLADAARDVKMAETTGGVYTGSYTVREGDGVFKSRVAVSFRDTAGKAHFTNTATFVSVDAPRGRKAPVGGPAPAIYAMTDDISSVVGVSGRLTAGKSITVTITGDPGNNAFFNIGEGIWKVPMSEDRDRPGTYTGAYTVQPGDNAGTSPDPLTAVHLEGYIESASGAVSEPARSLSPVVVDTTCAIDVSVSTNRMKADAKSQAQVVFTVTDADGEPVKGRRLTVLLEPPPRYTGVAGVGGVGLFDPARQEAEDGGLGTLEVDFDDMTDSYGQVRATYTSGFAAKTAMVVARDYATGSVGMNYIVTDISTSVNVTLTDQAGLSSGQDTVSGYELVVEFQPEAPLPDIALPYFMVDAIPNMLTADGRSRATVVATLTKDGLPVEGVRILFAVSGAGGTLDDASALTDIAGRAQTYYIAGRKAGYAIITATEPGTGVYVTKTITLLADAPAKMFARANPDTLPADGVSETMIEVGVTDVNDNPTEGARLEFSLAGPGRISGYEAVTDTGGRGTIYYTAGDAPGVATVQVTAVSETPASGEMDEARSRVVAPTVYDNDGLTELVVLKWYRSIGDQVGRGEPLALVQTPLGDMKVCSPVDGTLDEVTIEPGVYVMEGREIGAIRR